MQCSNMNIDVYLHVSILQNMGILIGKVDVGIFSSDFFFFFFTMGLYNLLISYKIHVNTPEWERKGIP